MQGSVAIVTGAARGIGFAIARRLGQAGHRIVGIDVLEDVLAASMKALNAEGIDARGLSVDLSDAVSIQSVKTRLGDDLGRVAVLVNNAGISPKKDGRKVTIEDISLAQWELTMRINLTAPSLLAQMVIPAMRANHWGRIVNISSRAARMPSGVAGVDYIVSKTGLIGVTKAIAQDYATDGITANAVAPGTVEGPMQQANDPATRAAANAKIPMGRLSSPEEVADAVAFLASEKASYITGVTLDVNGGVVMM